MSSAPVVETLSLAQARRAALAAQGFAARRPVRVGAAQISSLIARLGLLQIDSVNVVARAHLLPAFARLGPYDTAVLDRASQRSPRRLVEAWAHEASFVPPEVYHDLAWWRARQDQGRWSSELRAAHPGLDREVLAVVRDRGPLTSREIDAALGVEHPGGGWWNRSAARNVLERLFVTGHVASAGRTGAFERRYDDVARVIPPSPLSAEALADEERAKVDLVRRSARALGIASAACLRDYYRIKAADAAPAIATLVERGELLPVMVEGWGRAFLHVDAAVPRAVRARALLAPFDPLVFERSRLLALFGMHYRIGIYTPAAERSHGYYVLPFLLGEELVARVDLKADRAAGVLVLRQAHREEVPAGRTTRQRATWAASAVVARELVAELAEMARWLGLDSVALAGDAVGSLVPDLVAHTELGSAPRTGSAAGS